MHVQIFYPNVIKHGCSVVSFHFLRPPNFKLHLRSPLVLLSGTSAFVGKFIRSQRKDSKWSMSQFTCQSSRLCFQSTRVKWGVLFVTSWRHVHCWMRSAEFRTSSLWLACLVSLTGRSVLHKEKHCNKLQQVCHFILLHQKCHCDIFTL